jgi:acetyl-CoA synthetase
MNDEEKLIYYPHKLALDRAKIKSYDDFYKKATDNPLEFWENHARELHWFKRWDAILDDSNKPFYKWFINAKTNITYNCLDKHLTTFRRNKLALIWEGENGDTKFYSYFDLHREVCRFANILKSVGIKKGDRVTIYMGRIPELAISMLACARIGAVHSVVYGGFSVDALFERIEDSRSKVLLVADAAHHKGKLIKLKEIADEALKRAATIEHVIVKRHTNIEVSMESGRDMFLEDLMELPIANGDCPPLIVDAEDPLFILYTSGTTSKPKAILHVHGGYMVGVYTTLKYVFDITEEDRYWCAADPGWITGHSYIVYGPLLNGATLFMYEGLPNYPFPNRWWQMIEKYGINILYTAPTAIRGLMRFGEAWLERYNLKSLRILGSVGEPINPEVWKWYYEHVGKNKCPIIDTWWQTETGMHILTSFPCMPLKPGSAGKPFPALQVDVLDEEGKPAEKGKEGYLVIKNPWPSMVRTIYGDSEKYKELYWKKFPGVYFTGDSAKKDEDGYYWVLGRVDDVIKVSGYRLGTAEIENILTGHYAVAEAAAVGIPHEVKGNSIYAFVVLKAKFSGSLELKEELINHVSHELGPIAKPDNVEFVESLPKTRSGKIMRRLLKSQVLGIDPGNISTLEED